MKLFKKRNNPNNQKGFTLMELAVVVAVIGGLGTWALVDIIAPFNGKENVSIAGRDVATLVSASQDWSEGKVGYTGINVTKLTDEGRIDTRFSTGTSVNPWGGDYTVASKASSGLDLYTLLVGVTGVPTDSCTRLADKSPQAKCSSGTVTYTIQAI